VAGIAPVPALDLRLQSRFASALWFLRAALSAAGTAGREYLVLTETQDDEQIIERVAAIDIGKAELVCCVRVPDENKPGRRLQEIDTYSTMTRSLLVSKPAAAT
jgi:hypothetical protein